MDRKIYYRRKASQCRRFAAAMPILEDPARMKLLEIAAEFERKAEASEPFANTGHIAPEDGRAPTQIQYADPPGAPND